MDRWSSLIFLLFLHIWDCPSANGADALVNALVNLEKVLLAEKRLRGRVHNLAEELKQEII